MVLADTTITPKRSEMVDFTYPFMQTQLAILLEDPNARSNRRKTDSNTDDDQAEEAATDDDDDDDGDVAEDIIWFRPFTVWLWLTFIIIAIILLFIIYFVEKFVSKELTKTRSTNPADPPPPEKLLEKFSTRVFGTPK